ncbi:ComF family protein [Pontibacillus marinus]|uniref:Phosphoribosyltransferase domain-containing protein n=1 Tax=Pontibacillus marinus BH030004 = DSM 16465 TaxID=1385511 RepID=A0A0A5G6R1_9BACI|nr:ComF family protein [Pontibacillus marinus]KGX86790.1 hypothetical protein N783_11510 [Pontibacillus marinus BH030004 = DSM 16465]
MHCLWCDQKILPEVTWLTFLTPHKIKVLCEECKEKFSFIVGPVCIRCNRPMEGKGKTCYDCERWIAQNPSLECNISVFEYNSFMQEVISKWKYRGDYVLAELFREDVQQRFDEAFSHLNNLVVVPIPLSEERLQERGFNQAEAIASFVNYPSENAIKRIHTEKQSKKSRKERMTSTNPFQIQKPQRSTIVLIDDIYTTGRTLHHAAEVLKLSGAQEVHAFTLIRG